MNKIFVILLLFLTIQFAYGQEIRTEIIAGLNASQIDGDDMAGFNKLGLLIGGASGFQLKDNFGVRFRILFSQKGSRFSENDLNDLNYRLNYLDFPLLFQYTLDKELFENADRINLEAGLQFSYLLTAKEGLRSVGFINLYDDFEPRVYGLIIGAYYKLDPYIFRLNFQRSLVSLHKSIAYFDRSLSVSIAYQL